jgi:hypothetical protein
MLRPMEKTVYRIIESYGETGTLATKLAHNVQAALDDGFKLFGSPYMHPQTAIMYQAVVKDIAPPRPLPEPEFMEPTIIR